MAYYGPNAEKLLGIKLTLWHHNAISDIGGYITTLAMMEFIDLLSFIVNGIILKIFCKVNILIVLQKIQKDFWFYMAFTEAALFIEVNFVQIEFSTKKIQLILYQICSYFVAYLLEVEWTLLLHLNGLVETMSQEQEEDESVEDWKIYLFT